MGDVFGQARVALCFSVLGGSLVQLFVDGDFGTEHRSEVHGGRGNVLDELPYVVTSLLIAYIGPGPGLVVQGPALILLLGFTLAFLALITMPLRLLFRRRRARGESQLDRLVILGLDGLEPSRTERLMEEGRLPHLSALAQSGGYQRLATTSPPLSPVAWATFSTGVNPGKHGIFDFVKREGNYQPSLAFSGVEQAQASLGPLRLPWKTTKARFLRKSKSFWSILGEHGVFSQVLRVPVTWPPEKFDGLLLSAMGAPDLLGTQGTYTLFSRAPGPELLHGNIVQLQERGDALEAELVGPAGSTIKLAFKDQELLLGPHRIPLSESEYTPWVELKFGPVQGLAKFLALKDDSYYMSAIQIDPKRPSAPLSYPSVFATALSKILGPFATCGLAEDMGARDDGILSLEGFLSQAQEIHQEREKQFFHSLGRTQKGLCCVVFDGTDRIQHMTCDEKRLDQLYVQMDELVGRTKAEMKSQGELIVLSDHGFKPLLKLVDLNAWLQAEGYLHSVEEKIDWARTQAYTLGLAGISLNLEGRESQGTVAKEEAQALAQEIAAKLSQLTDGENQAILTVKLAAECYQGPYTKSAPDLVVGYNLGYGINKEAARGKVGDSILLDNTRPWVADHCFEPDLVPGVLFSSMPLKSEAALRDLAPTVLELFGVSPPSFQDGRSLVKTS